MKFLKNLTGVHKIIAIIFGIIFSGFFAYKIIFEYVLPYFRQNDIHPIMIVYGMAFIGTVYGIGKYLRKW